MAVVRLLRRKWAERDEKWPEVVPRAGPPGSDNLPGMAAVCGLPTADQERKKNVPTGETGGGTGPVVKPSPRPFQWVMSYTDCGGCCLENPEAPLSVCTCCNGRRTGARSARRSLIPTSSRAATPTSWCAATPHPETPPGGWHSNGARRFLNDALIFLGARRHGCVVLTRNIAGSNSFLTLGHHSTLSDGAMV